MQSLYSSWISGHLTNINVFYRMFVYQQVKRKISKPNSRQSSVTGTLRCCFLETSKQRENSCWKVNNQCFTYIVWPIIPSIIVWPIYLLASCYFLCALTDEELLGPWYVSEWSPYSEILFYVESFILPKLLREGLKETCWISWNLSGCFVLRMYRSDGKLSMDD